MAENTKTLRLTFTNEEGKKHHLVLLNAKVGLDEVAVRDAMNTIAKADVFKKEGVSIYKHAQSAAYIDRTVTDIFDDSETTAAK